MDMSVSQNVNLAHSLRSNTSDWEKYIFNYKAQKEEQEIATNTNEIIESIGLSKYKNEQAKNLPHGLLRLLEIGIALSVKPKLLLLDEPFTGMNPNETNKVIETVKSIHQKKGYTIILVEHNMPVVMGISNRVIVLNFGNKIAEGKPSEILKNQKVIEAYIGKDTK